MSYYYVFCNQLFDSMCAWISISKSFDTPLHDSMIKKTQKNKACLAAEYRHKEHFCECDKKTTEKVSVQISHTHCKVAWAYATLCHLVGRYLGKTSLCQHTYQYSRFWVDVTWLPSQKWMVHSTLQLHRGCAEAMRRPCDKSGTHHSGGPRLIASLPFTSAPKPRQHMQVVRAQMSHLPCRPMSRVYSTGGSAYNHGNWSKRGAGDPLGLRTSACACCSRQ